MYDVDLAQAPTPAATSPAETLGLRAMFGGASGGGLASWEHVCQQLVRGYLENDVEKARRQLAFKRDELYEGRGDEYLEELIEAAFKSELNRELRKAMVEWAKWNNVIGRLVTEKAKVYSVPPARRIKNGDDVYQEFLRRVRKNKVMKELNRKLVMHEDVWVQYRVRWTPRGRQPVIDVISPARFWAVHHPRDKTLLIAIILDQSPSDPALLSDDTPCYRVLADHETFMLDAKGRMLEATYELWPLGRMPGVLATTREPTTKECLLSRTPLSDGVAAHLSVWFLNVLGLKESKSANRQNYLSGDTADVALGQDADTETEVALPEGVNVQSVDRGMDLAQFRDMSASVVDDGFANHGIPPSLRMHKDATSGAEIHLRRIPLHELRIEQIDTLREVEREMCEIESGVNALADANGELELEEFQFKPDGFAIDYGEIAQPETRGERNQNFEDERRLNLTDTVEEMKARNPDLDDDAAAERIELFNTRETKRVAQQKTLMALNGSTSTAPDEKTPEQNGERGREADELARRRRQAPPPP